MKANCARDPRALRSGDASSRARGARGVAGAAPRRCRTAPHREDISPLPPDAAWSSQRPRNETRDVTDTHASKGAGSQGDRNAPEHAATFGRRIVLDPPPGSSERPRQPSAAHRYFVQNGSRPIADLMPLTIIDLNCAWPGKPEPSVKPPASWPSVVSHARPPS